MMLRPATVFMPTSPNSAFPQGVKTFDNEGVSAPFATRWCVSSTTSPSCPARTPSSSSTVSTRTEGRILAVLEPDGMGLVGYRKSVPTYHPQPYGHGCVLEIFNSSLYSYIEMEVHGPVVSTCSRARASR